jgi:hypothetical protein
MISEREKQYVVDGNVGSFRGSWLAILRRFRRVSPYRLLRRGEPLVHSAGPSKRGEDGSVDSNGHRARSQSGGAAKGILPGVSPHGSHVARRLFVALLACATVLYTILASSHGAHAGVLDDIKNAATSRTAGWLDPALGYATWLAGIAGVTGGIIAGVKYYSRFGTWEGVHYPLVDILFNLIPVLVMLRFGKLFLPHIFSAAAAVSTNVTGVVLTGPDSIVTIGQTAAGTIFAACTVPMLRYLAANPLGVIGSIATFGANNELFGLFGLIILGALAALVVLVAFALIACELLVSIVQVLFVATIGSVQIGWAAAPGTQHFAAEYWSSVLRSFFRVIVTYAVASFLSAASMTAFALPADTGDTTAMYATALHALAFAVAAWYLACKVPALAAEAFSGRPVLTGGGFGGHTASTVTSANGTLTRTFAKAGGR